jgi:NADPH-dependent curcumin reductase CurA
MPLTHNPTLVFTKIPGEVEPLLEGVHFKVEDRPLDLENVPLDVGSVLIRTIALSSDPYIRYRFRDENVPMFCPPILLNDP